MAVLSRVRRKWEEKENKEKKGKRKKKEFVKRMRRPKNVAAAEGKIWEIWSLHRGPEQPKIHTGVLGHSLVRSLVRSHRSLVRLLRTTRFAHFFTPSLVGK